MPEVQIGKCYEGKHRISPLAKEAYDAADFFPTLGKDVKCLRFNAAILVHLFINAAVM